MSKETGGPAFATQLAAEDMTYLDCNALAWRTHEQL